jgi:hypothetical protein
MQRAALQRAQVASAGRSTTRRVRLALADMPGLRRCVPHGMFIAPCMELGPGIPHGRLCSFVYMHVRGLFHATVRCMLTLPVFECVNSYGLAARGRCTLWRTIRIRRCLVRRRRSGVDLADPNVPLVGRRSARIGADSKVRPTPLRPGRHWHIAVGPRSRSGERWRDATMVNHGHPFC